jgi:hypothetical protein
LACAALTDAELEDGGDGPTVQQPGDEVVDLGRLLFHPERAAIENFSGRHFGAVRVSCPRAYAARRNIARRRVAFDATFVVLFRGVSGYKTITT